MLNFIIEEYTKAMIKPRRNIMHKGHFLPDKEKASEGGTNERYLQNRLGVFGLGWDMWDPFLIQCIFLCRVMP
jgi:hypothetical protein